MNADRARESSDGQSLFRLMVISDRSLMGSNPVSEVLELDPDGVGGWALQWREKAATPEENYRTLFELKSRTSSRLPSLLVNDRADLALALGIGVHLTETSLPTTVAKDLLGSGGLVGRSVHSVETGQQASEEGADYLLLGPVFETPSKRAYGRPLGLERLSRLASSVSIPVIAVGGIDIERVQDCLDAGAHGVAVIRAIWESPSPRQSLQAFLTRLRL